MNQYDAMNYMLDQIGLQTGLPVGRGTSLPVDAIAVNVERLQGENAFLRKELKKLDGAARALSDAVAALVQTVERWG